MKQLIECVPNISEGRDTIKIKEISEIVESIEGVKLLNVDPGYATNRTVITFVGEPKQVIEAAFLLIRKAKELIDMSIHTGAHPRMGATDVCPLVPIANITMNEVSEYAHQLSKRVGEELNIPIYCYENAAKIKNRKNLANCRSGEYEGLAKKLDDNNWKPDYGPNNFNDEIKRSGATAISARDFLVAYNINLNTTSTRKANSVAFDIREAGRISREGNSLNGEIINDKNGNPKRSPGLFKSVKGIGWFIKEYGIAQISYNLTDIKISTLHEVFDKTCERASVRGLRVTGSELIGLVPKKVLIDAGKYFLHKQQRSLGVSDSEIIKIAIKSLGLDELAPFNPKERVIEYMLEESKQLLLTNMSLTEFANETASESPAPGGGSISAYCGAMGVALGTMVANLSANKRGWDKDWEKFSKWAEKGLSYQNKLLSLVDEDTNAFNKIMEAFRMINDSKEDKLKRNQAIQEATKYAINTPFKVMEISLKSMEVMKEMARSGNPNSITDSAVGALCARTAIRGAYLNVQINCKDCEDQNFIKEMLKDCEIILEKAIKEENTILEIAQEKINL